ncbi:MAG: hypothetical protein ACLFTT_10895 [Candidatus Hydrogenedentota bacterium]
MLDTTRVQPPREEGPTISDESDADSMSEEWAPALRTPAGELERETLSRRENAVEGLAFITLILVALWGVGYYLGVLRAFDPANTVTNVLLVGGGLYLLLIAPFLHRDTSRSWGLGSPRTVLRLLEAGPRWRRGLFAAVLVVLFAGLNCVLYLYWPEVMRFLELDDTLLGKVHRAYPGRFVVFAIGGVLSAGIVLGAVRYDNFLVAFPMVLQIALPFLLLLAVVAWHARGPAAFSAIHVRPWLLGIFGYGACAFAQQLIFSGYLGTRFRKAFAPAPSPAYPPRAGRALLTSVLVGANIALGVYIFALIGLRLRHGVDAVPLRMPLSLALAVLPFALVYGWFYARARRRLLVATLTASCFASLHLGSMLLVGVVWLFMIPAAYIFMEDRRRNLAALSVAFGLLHSTCVMLFPDGMAGPISLDLAAGPYNIEYPTRTVLVAPVLCIAAYAGLLAVCSRTLSAAEPAEHV